ncbi:hypothetical protein FLB_17390 [Flavobacterium succinicans]|uniref:Uncharacterized protein n=1 Tax=Flavobacterium succinicans TaxID=29536 RepID=A0A199XRK1_9FLAO|nr:hypothetical protein FLB_17390 [Flavobacterium succinicans]
MILFEITTANYSKTRTGLGVFFVIATIME